MRRYPSAVADRITSIPLRPGVVVDFLDIPFDLTRAEAEKIGNVVKAMAVSPLLMCEERG